jgi:hypothetical protein
MSKPKKSAMLVDRTSSSLLDLHRKVKVLITCYGRRVEWNEKDGEHIVSYQEGFAPDMTPASLGMIESIELILSELSKRRPLS